MNAQQQETVADAVFRRAEYVDSLADGIERMSLTIDQAITHLRLIAWNLREQSDHVMNEVRR